MGNKLRRSTPKPSQKPAKSKPSVAQTKTRHQAPIQPFYLPLKSSPKWMNPVLAIVLLFSAIGLVVGGFWLSVQLMLDPDALVGFNQFLPTWTQIPLASRRSPQTLPEIRAHLLKQGLIPGEPLLVGKASLSKPGEFILPLLTPQPNCNPTLVTSGVPACQQIIELRVYQPAASVRYQKGREAYYQLVSEIAVAGPDESFAIAPLVNAQSASLGSTRLLPLTSLQRFDGISSNGVWLYLSGERSQGSDTVLYGQVVHYNPKRAYLSLMQQWTSPVGQVPQWQEVTGSGQPELVVNQTVGLEPEFEIYQIKSRNFLPDPVELEEISLSEPALDDPAYSKALLLARNGLWSTANEWLRSFKQRSKNWSATAQAQMDFIRWHAQATQVQAEKSWASPSQQVLVNLMDGRWTRALQVFQASADNSHDVAAFLKPDSARLQNRVNAALKVDPNQPDVKAWGALIIGAKKGKPVAIAWLRKQPKTSAATIARINKLLNRLDAGFTDAEVPSSSHASQILGSVQPMTQINQAEWLRLDRTPLKLEAEQTWYRVQVATFNDGKHWRTSVGSSLKSPKATSTQSLWNLLGLNTDAQLEIIFWLPDGQQETIVATIQAIQLQNGGLQILAVGDKPSEAIPRNGSKAAHTLPHPLAFTQAALQWVTPETTSLLNLNQQQPELVTMLPVLWRELGKARLLGAIMPDSEALLQQTSLGDWAVQLVDLTGDSQPEFVLTVNADMLTEFKKSFTSVSPNHHQPRTLIFSASGNLIYSEFGAQAGQSLTAIVNLGNSNAKTLVIDGARNYHLLHWSARSRQFESWF